MPYAAFFTDPHLPKKGEIIDFLISNLTDTWILDRDGEKKLKALDDIPKDIRYWHLQPWCMHGKYLSDKLPGFSISLFDQKKPEFNTNLDKIDTELSALSKKYDWILFPWGGLKPFLSIGFISNDKALFDKVKAHTSSSQRLISSYAFNDGKLSQVAHSVLLESTYSSVYPLWDVCNGDENYLWMVTEMNLSQDSFEADWWIPDGCSLLVSLGDFVDCDTDLCIYEIKTEESFKSICSLSQQLLNISVSTMIFIPSRIDLHQLAELILKMEDWDASRDSHFYREYYDYGKDATSVDSNSVRGREDYSFSDLAYLQEVISTVDWLFGVDRDRADYRNSLFVARDNHLLRKFTELTQQQDDKPRIIACF